MPVEKGEDIGAPSWPDRVPQELDFYTHVRPLLIINCIECHNEKDKAKYKNLSLQTKRSAFNSGDNGPVIKPGDPAGSLLIQMLKKDPKHQWAMPPTPDRIWGIRLQILEKWIAEGAKWPDGLKLEHPAEVEEL